MMSTGMEVFIIIWGSIILGGIALRLYDCHYDSGKKTEDEGTPSDEMQQLIYDLKSRYDTPYSEQVSRCVCQLESLRLNQCSAKEAVRALFGEGITFDMYMTSVTKAIDQIQTNAREILDLTCRKDANDKILVLLEANDNMLEGMNEIINHAGGKVREGGHGQ